MRIHRLPSSTRQPGPIEKKFICTVGTLAQTAKENKITKTALMLVGDAVNAASYDRSSCMIRALPQSSVRLRNKIEHFHHLLQYDRAGDRGKTSEALEKGESVNLSKKSRTFRSDLCFHLPWAGEQFRQKRGRDLLVLRIACTVRTLLAEKDDRVR